MTAQTLLRDLERNGVKVKVEGDKLFVTPRGVLGPDVRALLVRHKPEILALLQSNVQPDPLADLLQTPIRELKAPLAVESSILDETIYLVANDHQAATVRASGALPYTSEEIAVLWELHQAIPPEVWPARLRAIHEAKRRFGGTILPEGA